MRITTFTPEGGMMDDRLVMQDPEMAKGPNEPHLGPMRIEFTMVDQADTDKIKGYLDQLRGTLPIPERKKYGAKEEIAELTQDSREQLLTQVSELETQSEIILFLRENGFKFVTTEHLELLSEKKDNFKCPDFTAIHKKRGYQWLLRCIKLANSPMADKYDPTLVFGIQYLGEPQEKIPIYLYGEYHSTISKPIGKLKDSTKFLKPVEAMKFPPYMDQEDRDKFRIEQRKIDTKPEIPPSKFYLKWVKHVVFPGNNEYKQYKEE